MLIGIHFPVMSSMVREIAVLNGDFKELVPDAVYKKLKNNKRI